MGLLFLLSVLAGAAGDASSVVVEPPPAEVDEPLVGWTFIASLGGGPVWGPSLSAPLAPPGVYGVRSGAGGLDLFGGVRIGRRFTLGLMTTLGVGMIVGVELRVMPLRLGPFDLWTTATFGPGLCSKCGAAEKAGPSFRAGVDLKWKVIGIYARATMHLVGSEPWPGFSVGVSLQF